MRRNKKSNHLGRTNTHRNTMFSDMVCLLIKHKRIFTTTAKAKALRRYAKPPITKSEEDTAHSRRMVFSNLRNELAVIELFKEIARRIGDCPGSYTRITKTSNRLGDNAVICSIELVGYNESMLKDTTTRKTSKTRRSHERAITSAAETPTAGATSEEKVAE